MSNQSIVDKLLVAMEMVAKNETDNSGADRTFSGTIISQDGTDKTKYIVRIDGADHQVSSTYAEYKVNDEVYVTMPGGLTTSNMGVIIGLKYREYGGALNQALSDNYDKLTSNALTEVRSINNSGSITAIDNTVLRAAMIPQAATDEAPEVLGSDTLLAIFNLTATASDGDYELIFEVAYKFATNEEAQIKEFAFTINDVHGNPFALTNQQQFLIMQLPEGAIFDSVNEITLSSTNATVAVNNLELYGAREAFAAKTTAARLWAPDGTKFDSATTGTLTLKAQMRKEGLICALSDTSCYWFKEDPLVTSADNPGYSIQGGMGWRLLNTKTEDGTIVLMAPILEINKTDIVRENVKYKCVIEYNGQVYSSVNTVTFTNVDAPKLTFSIETSDDDENQVYLIATVTPTGAYTYELSAIDAYGDVIEEEDLPALVEGFTNKWGPINIPQINIFNTYTCQVITGNDFIDRESVKLKNPTMDENTDPLTLTLDNDSDIIVRTTDGQLIGISEANPLIVNVRAYQGSTDVTFTPNTFITIDGYNDEVAKSMNFDFYYSVAEQKAQLRIKGFKVVPTTMVGEIEIVWKPSADAEFEFARKKFTYKIIVANVDYNLKLTRTVINLDNEGDKTVSITVLKKTMSENPVELTTIGDNKLQLLVGEEDYTNENWSNITISADTVVQLKSTAEELTDLVWDTQTIETVSNGNDGISFSGVIEYYKAGTSRTEPPAGAGNEITAPTGWSTTIADAGHSETNKYLWNIEGISSTGANGTISTTYTAPDMIQVWNGRTIDTVTSYYQTSTGTTAPGGAPSLSNNGNTLNRGSWPTSISTTPDEATYLWEATVTKYKSVDTNGHNTYEIIPAHIIGYNGRNGTDGKGVTIKGVAYVNTIITDNSINNKFSLYLDEACTQQITNPADADAYLVQGYLFVYSGSNNQFTCVGKIQGPKGSDGNGISNVINYYMASGRSSGVSAGESGEQPDEQWDTSPQTTTQAKPFLWNYEIVFYTDMNSQSTEPTIIGYYTEDGRGIQAIHERYCISASNTITKPDPFPDAIDIPSTGAIANTWYKTSPATTPTLKYLWNCEKVDYTDGTSDILDPALMGTHGTKGETGSPGDSVYVYSQNAYMVRTVSSRPTAPSGTPAESGSAANTWYLTPINVDATNQYGFVVSRSMTETNGGAPVAGSWETPMLYAKYGVNGQNGSDATVNTLNTFNALTNGGKDQGIYFKDSSGKDWFPSASAPTLPSGGKLYINASMIKTGILEVADGNNTVFSAAVGGTAVTIGQFTVNSESSKGYIASNNKTSYSSGNGVYLGTDGIGVGNGKFYVTANGTAHFEGEITATKLTVASNATVSGVATTAQLNATNNNVTLAKSAADTANTTLTTWSYTDTNSTTIQGGQITTGGIAANKIAVNYIKSNGCSAVKTDGTGYTTTGTFFDLTNGNIHTPNFSIVGGNARFTGTVYATAGEFTGEVKAGSKISINDKFSVTNAGYLTALSGNIGGWSINTSYLSSKYCRFYGNGSTETIWSPLSATQIPIVLQTGEVGTYIPVDRYDIVFTIPGQNTGYDEEGYYVIGPIKISNYFLLSTETFEEPPETVDIKIRDGDNNIIRTTTATVQKEGLDLRINYVEYGLDEEPFDLVILKMTTIKPKSSINLASDGFFSAERGHIATIVTASAPIIASDEHVKNSIAPLSDDYETIFDNLEPVSYKYNNGTSGRTHIGFIAQPTNAARALTSITQDEFAPLCLVNRGQSDEHWAIRYEEFIALNTDQIQKTKKRVAQLEIENSKLHERIGALEDILNTILKEE